MLYGVILDSARETVVHFYGQHTWKRIVQALELPSERFNLFEQYDEKLLLQICEYMEYLLHETAGTYLEFFGGDFIRYFIIHGFDKIIRVAGRTMSDFLYAIDQLHDSNRYTFPRMNRPLFHVTEENELGARLDYQSVRRGFARYAIGGVIAAGKMLFHESIEVKIIADLSTNEHSHFALLIQFDNKVFRQKRLRVFPSLPDIRGETVFRIFPYSILIDFSLHICQVGKNCIKLFPEDTHLIGRSLGEVFRLIRPDIDLEWEKILSYGRHIVFLVENRLPLRIGPSGRVQLKGQMKYIENRNLLWYLCHPVLLSTNDMISAGMHLCDLNLFDNTSELLITGIHQEREIEQAIDKQQMWIAKLQEFQARSMEWREKSESLLYSILPKHIALMIQSGIQPNSICESQPLVTVLFAYLTDFISLNITIDSFRVVECLNQVIIAFDQLSERYDVFKLEMKADSSYMVVAGLKDRSHVTLDDLQHLSLSDKEINKNPLGLHQTEIIAALALDLRNQVEQIINPVTDKPFQVKIGFHSGSAVGGIVGQKNIQYCLFGDTINTASRITTTSEVGRIHFSQSSYDYLSIDNRFSIECRGQIEMKGKGLHSTYWLLNEAKRHSVNPIARKQTPLKCFFSMPSNEYL